MGLDLNLSHFGLLIFGFMLAWPRKGGSDEHDRVGWVLVGLIFVAIAWLWQNANGWPGASSKFTLAMMLYGAMFVLGILCSVIITMGYQSCKRSFKKLRRRSS